MIPVRTSTVLLQATFEKNDVHYTASLFYLKNIGCHHLLPRLPHNAAQRSAEYR
jgi:hypothetical protein